MSLNDWLLRLGQLHHKEVDLGLDRVRAVQDALGLGACSFAVVTVGGTNGKGSIVAMLEAMYRSAGYRVAAYTSPHLLRFNERIRVNGRDASDAELVGALAEVERARSDVPLTYFEFATLAAAALFRSEHVDLAILEVGLGGRLDAVNAFDADVAIVASIGLDHLDYLGPDRNSIAREKAGIFRRGRPAICGEEDPPEAIGQEVTRIGSEWLQIHRDFSFVQREDAWQWQYHDQIRSGLPLPTLRGRHQLNNASCALMAAECLKQRFPTGMADVRAGLAARIAARFDVRPRAGKASVIFDVAHNGAAATALADSLRHFPSSGRTLAVCGILGDKQVEQVAAALKLGIDEWHVAGLAGARGMTATATATRLQEGGVTAPVFCHPDPKAAFAEVERVATATDRIVVFGSFHTVSAILALPEFQRKA